MYSKTPAMESVCSKVAGGTATLFQKVLYRGWFPMYFAKYFRMFFFVEHLWATVFDSRYY